MRVTAIAMTMRILITLSSLALMLSAGVSIAEPWSTELKNGTSVYVDPRTNKAWYETPAGPPALLWNGVHQLRDGSVIIIRDGTVVPNEQIYQARERPAAPQVVGPPVTTGQFTACVRLVSKTCGGEQQCADAEPCRLAKQLREFEIEELNEIGYTTTSVAATRQCEEALTDGAYFTACPR
jgi:hypothetical protein